MKSFRIASAMAILASSSGLFMSESARSETHAWKTFRNGAQNRAVSPISVKSLSKEASREVREFQTGGLIWATPVVDDQDNVYFGAANKNVYKIDRSGTQKWMYTLFDRPDSLVDSAAALLTYNGKDLVIVPGGDGYLHALDRNTGDLAWYFRSNGASDADHDTGKVVNSFEGNVQVGPNGIIYAGSDNGYMYAIDPGGAVNEDKQMVKELWRFRTGDKDAKKPKDMIWSSPAFDLDNEWMAFGGLDGNFYLLNPSTGDELDRFDAGGTVKSSPSVDEHGNLYFGTANGKFLSFNVKIEKHKYQLHKRWDFDTRGEIYSSPAIKDGRIIFGSLDGYLYCLDSDGHLLWQFGAYSEFGISRLASSPLITQDNVVLFGAKNGKLYAVDAYTGERIWSYQATLSPMKSNLDASPALDSSGMIHVGSYNGIFYQIPYEYCLNHREDSRCKFDGKDDLRDWSNRHDGTFAELRRTSEDLVSTTGHIELRLVAFEKSKYVDMATVDASSVRIKTTPYVELDVQVSSDGGEVNLLPKTFFNPDQTYIIDIEGFYFSKNLNRNQKASAWGWFMDRFEYFGRKAIKSTVSFRTSSNSETVFDSISSNSTVRWGLSSYYLTQPKALDTYLPAALDGQSFVATAFGFNPDRRSAMVLLLPGVVNNGRFSVYPEPSKVVTLDAKYDQNSIKGVGTFSMAGMGGEIPFDPMVYSMGISKEKSAKGETERGQFNSVANVTQVKGNGSQYAFPALLMNQICDPWLRVIGMGSFCSQVLERESIGNYSEARLEDLNDDDESRFVKVDFSADLQQSHLLTYVEWDSEHTKVTHIDSKKVPEQAEKVGNLYRVKFKKKCLLTLKCTRSDMRQVFFDTQPLIELEEDQQMDDGFFD